MSQKYHSERKTKLALRQSQLGRWQCVSEIGDSDAVFGGAHKHWSLAP